MIFSGLSCRPEGMNQFVLNVLQDHSGQRILAVTVSVHAGRVWMCRQVQCERVPPHVLPPSTFVWRKNNHIKLLGIFFCSPLLFTPTDLHLMSPLWTSLSLSPCVKRTPQHKIQIIPLPAWCWTALFCHCYYGETVLRLRAPLHLLLLLLVTLIRMVEDLRQRLLLPPKRTEKTAPTTATPPPPHSPFSLSFSQSIPPPYNSSVRNV